MSKIYSKCENCGGSVSRDVSVCPHCGVRFAGEKWVDTSNKVNNKKFEEISIIISGILSIIVFIFLVLQLGWDDVGGIIILTVIFCGFCIGVCQFIDALFL